MQITRSRVYIDNVCSPAKVLLKKDILASTLKPKKVGQAALISLAILGYFLKVQAKSSESPLLQLLGSNINKTGGVPSYSFISGGPN